MTYKNIGCVLAFAAPLVLHAAENGVQYYSASDLKSQAKMLAGKTPLNSHVAAVEPLMQYKNDHTALIYRDADGLAELHENESDLYFVVGGEGTIVTGGTILDRKQKSVGEFTGSGISGGHSQPLKTGDVVHIAPDVPHEIKVKPGMTLSYFVQKVKEK